MICTGIRRDALVLHGLVLSLVTLVYLILEGQIMPDPQSGDGESRLSKTDAGLDQTCSQLECRDDYHTSDLRFLTSTEGA